MYNLRLYSPILQGQNLVGDVTNLQNDWRRSIRSMGGFWQGTFSLSNAPLSVLEQFFYDYMGFHFEEHVTGDITWEGLIYEMDFDRGGGQQPRKRSFDVTANAIKATYTLDNVVSESAWATQAKSIARYGRKEEWISMDQLPQVASEQRRDVMLNQVAWPWPRPQQASAAKKPTLRVLVCGYVFTANWKFTALATPGDITLSDYILALIGETQFLSAGNVKSNSLLVREKTNAPIRIWDRIQKMADLGDSTLTPWRAYVGVGRKLNLTPVDVNPKYQERTTGLYHFLGPRVDNPWLVQPGVVRDMTYPTGRDEPGSFLNDSRDAYVEQVEVASNGQIVLSPHTIDDIDVLTFQQNYATEIKETDYDITD